MISTTLPILSMAAVSIYAGIYHILFGLKKIAVKLNYSFALLCFAVAYYQISAFFLYNITDYNSAISPTLNLFCAVSIINTSALWFFYFLTEQKRINSILIAGTSISIILLISPFLLPDHLLIQNETWLRNFSAFGSFKGRILQVKPGILWICQDTFAILNFSYLLFVIIKHTSVKNNKGIKLLIVNCILLFAAAAHDILGAYGFLESLNLVEYAYTLIVISMANVLVNMFAGVKQELYVLNNSLEQKIISQTVKLCEAMEELETANKKLRRLSNSDPLTQIPNRRNFFKNFSKEWKSACRNKTPLSIIMIDIDFFKQFNDTYGHIAGDECLKKVAYTIKNSVKRPLDITARYGGEEFIVLLPTTDLKGASHIAELIRKKIKENKIPHESSTVSKWVTISLGCSTAYPESGDNQNNFINAADEALYNSKDNGRDCVTSINYYCHKKKEPDLKAI